MRKKYSSSQKLQIVLEHHLIVSEPSAFKNVAALKARYGISGEHLRQWRQLLHGRIDEIYADGRKRLHRDELIKRLERLQREYEDLRRQVGDYDPSDL